jgi:hypothetical protein
LAFAGLAILLLWGAWWTASLYKKQFILHQWTWVPATNWLGLDFLNNYHAARHWLAGGNPYTEQIDDPMNRPFIYSPVVLGLFSWCRFLSASQATVIWTLALAALAAVGAVACWRTRRRLGLWELPLPFLLAAVLGSFPVLFELERGNCDLLVLLLIVMTASALAKQTLPRDSFAGFCVALAVWIKIYPAMLVLGLLAARRYRAVVCVVLAYLAIGLADYPGTVQHIHAMRSYVADYDMRLHASAHPFGTWWKHFWENTPLAIVTKMPGILGASCVLAPLVLWVSCQFFQERSRGALLFPYLAWLTAVGTFLPPVSNDYNLFFLPLAALAVWDRRDRVIVHLLMALLLLWWQPIQLPIGATLVFTFKLAGLAAVGTSLVARVREQGVAATGQETTPMGTDSLVAAAA